MSKPIAVLISDIHFTVPTLELATASLTQALLKADELEVPLIIAGDLLDSKAIVRAECANRLIQIFDNFAHNVLLIPGNHDMINEKSREHSLNFLKGYVTLVDEPTFTYLGDKQKVYLIPYQSDPANLQHILSSVAAGSTIILHQGVQTADMGHYIQDRTSLLPEAFADFRVISGHYHKAQDIKCGRPRKGAVGLFSYIGNPYTLSFGEVNDGPKGFQILHDDGILHQVLTNLRKHIIIEGTISDFALNQSATILPRDKVMVKLKGTRSELSGVSRNNGLFKALPKDFKLELIVLDDTPTTVQTKSKMSNSQLFDEIIDGINDTFEHKTYLKQLWRDLLDENT